MRRTGHIRERSPGSFELRYSFGTNPATGKRKVATATVRGSRKDAEKELRRLLHAADTGQHVDPTRMTVRRWLTLWLETIRHEVASRSLDRYTDIVNLHLIPGLGHLPLAKLSPAHIQELYNRLAVEGRRDGRPGPLAARSRRQIHRVLSSALRRGVEQQVITRNPCDLFRKRLPKVENREMVELTSEQSALLLNALRYDPIYWPVLIALATGARRGEALALRWRHVDLDRGAMRITESLEQTQRGLRFKPPKNNRSRLVVLPAFAIEELRRRKKEQAEQLLRCGVRQSQDTLLCARPDGEPITPVQLTHRFTRLTAKLEGIPLPRFHDLRHTHATQLLLAGVHPRIAQERLGAFHRVAHARSVQPCDPRDAGRRRGEDQRRPQRGQKAVSVAISVAWRGRQSRNTRQINKIADDPQRSS
jgi:integrase